MDADKAKLVSLLTNNITRAIAYDLDITLDNLKNSGWTTALAGAGLGLSLTKWNIYDFAGRRHAALLFALAHAIVSVPLLMSVALGAYLNWRINKHCSGKRQMITLLLGQDAMLVTGEDAADKGHNLIRKVFSAEFLVGADKEKYLKLSKEDKTLGRNQGWVSLQQSLMVLGYLGAVVLAAVYQFGNPHNIP